MESSNSRRERSTCDTCPPEKLPMQLPPPQQQRLVAMPKVNVAERVRSWLVWITSVLVCSMLLSALQRALPAAHPAAPFDSIQHLHNADSIHAGADSAVVAISIHPSTGSMPGSSMSSTPAALQGRASTCAAGEEDGGQYDMPLRIGAIFIILFVSASACAFPLLASRMPGLRIPSDFFFGVRHFGTGVLIATAFCHLLPTGFTLLLDPCLDEWWTQSYQPLPGAISLGAVLFVTAIEMWLHPGRHHHAPPPADKPSAQSRKKGQFIGRSRSIGRSLSVIEHDKAAVAAIRSGVLEGDPDEAVAAPPRAGSPGPNNNSDSAVEDAAEKAELTPEQKRKREIMQCFLLEMGILFHSVFIGMALSVTLGNQFVVLLIAISFHQTFEGLALGARIAAIDWPKNTMRPWLMALAYGCTTPLGQAIGLATRSAYSPTSAVGLVLVGVMNSISAGLLIFASLIELLSEDLLSDESWKTLRGIRRVIAFLLVIAGSFGMSLVGAWA